MSDLFLQHIPTLFYLSFLGMVFFLLNNTKKAVYIAISFLGPFLGISTFEYELFARTFSRYAIPVLIILLFLSSFMISSIIERVRSFFSNFKLPYKQIITYILIFTIIFTIVPINKSLDSINLDQGKIMLKYMPREPRTKETSYFVQNHMNSNDSVYARPRGGVQYYLGYRGRKLEKIVKRIPIEHPFTGRMTRSFEWLKKEVRKDQSQGASSWFIFFSWKYVPSEIRNWILKKANRVQFEKTRVYKIS